MPLGPRVATALVRARLVDEMASQLWERGVGLVAAPAGSGKTTLLSHLAATSEAPYIWINPEPTDGESTTFFGRLHHEVSAALGAAGTPWATIRSAIDGLAAALEGRRLLVVMDDVHLLEGTAAGVAIDQLAARRPDGLALVLAARRLPRFLNVSRLRVSESLVEFSADDLRFRTWEVEQLFRTVYAEPLVPEDLAELARRTGGWAAALQLFHLATRGKPAGDRHRMVLSLAERSRLVREYLTRNVVDELDPTVRRFVLNTSVLERLTSPLCDQLLGHEGSGALLSECERLQLLSGTLDGGDTRHYHEVLRVHLQALLAEEIGEAGLREHQFRAAQLLEAQGHVDEALRAYCRAGDWGSVTRVSAGQGGQRFEGASGWIETLPPAVLEQDPWLLAAAARRQVAAGKWNAAFARYQAAERSMGRHTATEHLRRERRSVQAWFESDPWVGESWLDRVRQAARSRTHSGGNRARSGSRPSASTERLADGFIALLDGSPAAALDGFNAVLHDPLSSVVVTAGATMGLALTALMEGQAVGRAELDDVVDDLDAAGLPWLAMLALGVRHAAFGEVAEVCDLAAACSRGDDVAGAALLGLLAGLSAPIADPAAAVLEALESAADRFARPGLAVLEAWTRALLASRAPTPDRIATAINLARGAGAGGALALASESARATARAPRVQPLPQVEAVVRVRCFGGFAIEVDGRLAQLEQVKPRARSALRLLALHAGRPVHREVLIEALWPNADPLAATRSLQVALSSLRGVLEPEVGRGQWSVLVRHADSYVLALAAGSESDVALADEAVAVFRRAQEKALALDAARRVIALCHQELLPEEGPAEWVLQRRSFYRSASVEAAARLASELISDDPDSAVEACETGLAMDRFDDGLWRLLINAHRRRGAAAAARRALEGYAAILREVGVLDVDAAIEEVDVVDAS